MVFYSLFFFICEFLSSLALKQWWEKQDGERRKELDIFSCCRLVAGFCNLYKDCFYFACVCVLFCYSFVLFFQSKKSEHRSFRNTHVYLLFVINIGLLIIPSFFLWFHSKFITYSHSFISHKLKKNYKKPNKVSLQNYIA